MFYIGGDHGYSARIMAAKTFCPQCGQEVDEGAAFCVHCGARLEAVSVLSADAAGATAAPLTRQTPEDLSRYGPHPFSTDMPVHYGGFWVRLAAVLIDAIVIDIVVLPLAFLLGGMIAVASVATRMPAGGAQIVGMVVGFGLGVFAAWIYEAAMESSAKRATLGKMILGLQVTDMNGDRICFLRATARHFAKYLSGLSLLIGYIMAGLSERKQALHDRMANTLVTYRR